MKKRDSQLKESGHFKLTSQRRAILEVLDRTRGRHLTAEEVYTEVKKSVPGIGMATVYRTLDLLARMDILQKSTFDEGKYRYEFSDEGRHFHHHFICLGCGRIDEVHDDMLHGIERELERKGYQIVDHALKLYGYCPNCKGDTAGEAPELPAQVDNASIKSRRGREGP